MEVKKKVNNLIPMLIQNGVVQRHRSLFLVVGDYARDQVANIHFMLSQARQRARPSVLWCYKSELGFSSNKQKRADKIKKHMRQGTRAKNFDDPFEMFLSSTDITYTYYKETENILGRTFGMVVLQDFQSLTPNIIARTLETVEGGGVIILLLKSITSLKQIMTMTMDAHSAFKNSAFNDVAGRFNYRFLLSLATCKQCCVVDDELNVLPISSHIFNIQKINTDGTVTNLAGETTTATISPAVQQQKRSNDELKLLQQSLSEVEHIGTLIQMVASLDQAKAFLKSTNVLANNNPNSTVTMFAGRGRGKSACLGFVLAQAVVNSYSNIFLCAPSPSNVITVFEFAIKALEALGYKRNIDFDIIEGNIQDYIGQHSGFASDRQSKKVITGLTIHSATPQQMSVTHSGSALPPHLVEKQRKQQQQLSATQHHRQSITFITPHDHMLLTNCDLLLIDEAAAIPLPHILRLMKGPGAGAKSGAATNTTDLVALSSSNRSAAINAVEHKYIVFLSSTVNGYEGTGRALSYQLIQSLRSQTQASHVSALSAKNKAHQLHNQHLKLQNSVLENRLLEEITLAQPIRYAPNDGVESWMNKLLCLDCGQTLPKLVHAASSSVVSSGLPHPNDCRLFYVSRDTLFSYHDLSECILQQLMALFVSSTYQNTPNDLQLLADAPQHHIFVLLGPSVPGKAIPDIFAVAQVCLEGNINTNDDKALLAAAAAAAQSQEQPNGNEEDAENTVDENVVQVATSVSQGDLIPWAIAQQYLTHDFSQLTGGRVYRIAVHPDVQHLGYGTRLLSKIIEYYDGDIHNITHDDSSDDDDDDGDNGNLNTTDGIRNDNHLAPIAKQQAASSSAPTKSLLLSEDIAAVSKNLPPLFVLPEQRHPEIIHWLGVSYGLTPILHRFFKKHLFYPLFIKQTPNVVTGEYTTIMVRAQTKSFNAQRLALQRGITLSQYWLPNLFHDFRSKLMGSLSNTYHDIPAYFLSEILNRFPSFFHQKTIQQEQQEKDAADADANATSIQSQSTTQSPASTSSSDPANPFTMPLLTSKNRATSEDETSAIDNKLLDTNEFAASTVSREVLYDLFTPFDLKRLDSYCHNTLDYSLIINTLPHLARLFFQYKLTAELTATQQAILLGVGLQAKSMAMMQSELQIGAPQVLALFNKTVRRLIQCVRFVEERAIVQKMAAERKAAMQTLGLSNLRDLSAATDLSPPVNLKNNDNHVETPESLPASSTQQSSNKTKAAPFQKRKKMATPSSSNGTKKMRHL